MAEQKIFKLQPRHLDIMPNQLEEGVLYISEKYGVATHLCCCGCKGKTVTPINDKNGWTLTKNDQGAVMLRPSIGNFSGEKPYHAHYYITNNQIEWL